ncbi:hypothetical protein ZYGM_002814 [Zygosaccharomyces mellis]|uniref:Uncharacterized protein n=1 Tax=Zygosaccharomyces mellis TaxID=42258 RepID=A0A4C2EAD7_9SACH|nr:hypothetical protein ZYGM_002814 [Zygosaccharomyces mellis]
MDTPDRFGNTNSDFVATTPFRERALQEQRLKEELLSSATSGWRERSPKKRVDGISKDPNEVKDYLRDLSSVLVSQGRNLTSVLTERASTQEDQTDTEVKSPPKQLTSQKSQHSIAETVLSQLESGIQRPKIRKIDGLVIRDIERASFPENYPLERQTSSPATLKSPFSVDENIPVQENALQDEVPVETGLDPAHQVAAPSGSPADFGSPLSIESDQSSIESEPETVDPLNIVHLKHSLGQFISANGIRLGQGSWRTLQDTSVSMVERLANYFIEDEKIVIDRQSILKMLEQLEIMPLRANNDDIFEMCCKYLPLEELNELEMALFL